MTQSRFITLASLLLASGVILGAFGAHALKSRVDAYYLAIWEKAVFYHLLHALGILVLAASAEAFQLAGQATLLCLGFGVLVFSGSLYLLVLTKIGWLGAITPIGGTAMIFGWLILAWAALRK
jgi:uncharacterized membrane protein YgdD (TMEM256/DUF423 family)